MEQKKGRSRNPIQIWGYFVTPAHILRNKDSPAIRDEFIRALEKTKVIKIIPISCALKRLP
jgi:hypothetical protein